MGAGAGAGVAGVAGATSVVVDEGSTGDAGFTKRRLRAAAVLLGGAG